VKSPSTFQEEEAHCWTRRYEQLREAVLSHCGLIATDCRGLSLLMRQGVAAWMRAWQEPICCPAGVLEAEARPVIRPTESWQQEATRLLVNMALGHLKL
jgi:hypothetical protein